jgi:AcrR family transcriptional regulator
MSDDVGTVDVYREFGRDIQPANSRQLLLAALHSFAVHGFEAATTRDIAERAGLSPAGVYVHYRSKQDLLYEIVRMGHEAVLAETTRAVGGETSPALRLQRFVQAFATWHARFHTLALVSQYELRYLSAEPMAEVSRLRRQFMERVEGMLDAGIEREQFQVLNVRATARAVLSLGIDVARWYKPDLELSPARVGELYGHLALRMAGCTSVDASG